MAVWVCVSLSAAFLSGCAEVAPRAEVQLKQATVEELTALLRQREAAIQTMKGLFSAKVRGGIIPIASRVEGSVYYQRPNAMRLRGFRRSAVNSLSLSRPMISTSCDCQRSAVCYPAARPT
jgi:outer membrane lipoprotein-sorting protein